MTPIEELSVKIFADGADLAQTCVRRWTGTVSELDLDPRSCGVVTSFCVLPHHLTNPTPDMRAVERMLKPGGWFVLQFPADGLFRRAGKAFVPRVLAVATSAICEIHPGESIRTWRTSLRLYTEQPCRISATVRF